MIFGNKNIQYNIFEYFFNIFYLENDCQYKKESHHKVGIVEIYQNVSIPGYDIMFLQN